MARWHAREWNGRSRRNSGRKRASGSRNRRSRTPDGSRGIWKTRARTCTISSPRLTSSRHSSRKGPTGRKHDLRKDSSIRGRVPQRSVGSLAVELGPSKPKARVRLPPHALGRTIGKNRGTGGVVEATLSADRWDGWVGALAVVVRDVEVERASV